MDLGGTNLRVMLMEISPGQEMKSTQFNTRIPDFAMHGNAEQVNISFLLLKMPIFSASALSLFFNNLII